MAPKILIVAWETTWMGIARLPKALQAAGFQVGLLCHADSFLAKTSFRDDCFHWQPLFLAGTAVSQLTKVVKQWQPDLLVPADEVTVVFFARLLQCSERIDPRLSHLLRHSLTRAADLLEASDKYKTLKRAKTMGVRVPDFSVICHESAAEEHGKKNGFPFLLKRTFSSGGTGVFLCHDEKETRKAWQQLYPTRARWKKWIYHGRRVIRLRELPNRWQAREETVITNLFIAGVPAMCLGVAFQGKLLGVMTAQKEETFPSALSPSCVIRFVEHGEMRAVAEKLAAAWRWTGFIGFDFILDAQNQAWLIECNPRPTPLAHLGSAVGVDLCAALFREVTAQASHAMVQVNGLKVAQYPREQLRDPASPHLQEAFHDIPHDDPPLLNCFREWYNTRKGQV